LALVALLILDCFNLGHVRLFNVFVQIAADDEASPAAVADEWPFPGMNSHVNVKHALLTVLFVAYFALKLELVKQVLVFVLQRVCPELLTAKFALESFLKSMLSKRFILSPTMGKSKRAWPLPKVGPWPYLQIQD
jgi:hypothetical protein